jgi:hypothetical protein
MAITASKVVAGMTILASHINKLIDDILSHTHVSGEGGTVPHNVLSDGVITGTYLNHVDISKHVQGSGTTEHGSDSPGGSQGVHGLNTSAYVAGAFGGQFYVQKGTCIPSTYLDAPYIKYVTVTFSPAFASPPIIAVTPTERPMSEPFYYLQDVVSGSFKLCSSGPYHDHVFHWIAIGTM